MGILETEFKKQISDLQEESNINMNMLDLLDKSNSEDTDDFYKFQYKYQKVQAKLRHAFIYLISKIFFFFQSN